MYKQIFASSLIALALITVSMLSVSGAFPVQAAPAVCGNDIVETGEECDGSANCTTDCRLSTPAPACGNDIIETGEQCDGSTNCTTDCKLSTPAPACGNDIVETGEECDGSANCTTSCILKEEGGNGGGGGGGGGSSGGQVFPRISIMQNGPIPQVRARSNTVGSLSIHNYGSITAPNVEITFTSLPAGFSYNGKNAVISTSTVWILEGNDYISQVGGVIKYPRLWRIGNRPRGDIAVMNIPLTVGANVKPGTYEIPVVAHISRPLAIDKDVETKLKITVISGAAPVVKAPTKTVVKAPAKKQIAAVAKPAVKPKATSTICIPTDEYAALMAASTTSAVTEPTNALAALGLLFDLGTGSPCFGLLVLLLIILAVIIAIRLIFHYMDAETDGTPRNQMPLIK